MIYTWYGAPAPTGSGGFVCLHPTIPFVVSFSDIGMMFETLDTAVGVLETYNQEVNVPPKDSAKAKRYKALTLLAEASASPFIAETPKGSAFRHRVILSPHALPLTETSNGMVAINIGDAHAIFAHLAPEMDAAGPGESETGAPLVH